MDKNKLKWETPELIALNRAVKGFNGTSCKGGSTATIDCSSGGQASGFCQDGGSGER